MKPTWCDQPPWQLDAPGTLARRRSNRTPLSLLQWPLAAAANRGGTIFSFRRSRPISEVGGLRTAASLRTSSTQDLSAGIVETEIQPTRETPSAIYIPRRQDGSWISDKMHDGCVQREGRFFSHELDRIAKRNSNEFDDLEKTYGSDLEIHIENCRFLQPQKCCRDYEKAIQEDDYIVRIWEFPVLM